MVVVVEVVGTVTGTGGGVSDVLDVRVGRVRSGRLTGARTRTGRQIGGHVPNGEVEWSSGGVDDDRFGPANRCLKVHSNTII